MRKILIFWLRLACFIHPILIIDSSSVSSSAIKQADEKQSSPLQILMNSQLFYFFYIKCV